MIASHDHWVQHMLYHALRSPLMLGALYDNPRSVEALLAANGIQISLEDEQEKKAMDYAEANSSE